MKKILFSPVGLTDPISNFRDGAMLHICRYYNIDKVYIFLSKEVYDYHQKDNRYLYCLDKLSEIKDKNIETELIIREDLVDVHIFDIFINEFRDALLKIHKKEKDSKFYVNVSSGTPAMKSALQVLAAFGEIEMIPVQVSTPVKKSNPHAEEKVNYEPEAMWECNEDNDIKDNRCSLSENFNFLIQIKKKMIAELIEQYDYIGAKTIAESIKDSLDNKSIEMIDGACKRYMFDYNKANNIFKKYDEKILEEERSNLVAICEYFLILYIKLKKAEYADFLRGITPLMADIFELILSHSCNFNVKDYVFFDNKKIRRWDIKKLENDSQVKSELDKKYGGMREQFISSDHLVEIISIKSNNPNLCKVCNELRELEVTARNITAHEIVTVTNEGIKGNVSFNLSLESAVDKLFYILSFTHIKVKKEVFFESYNKMNKIIIESLNI